MKLESGLSEGQVLQRLGSKGASVTIKGTSEAAGPIRVTISGRGSALKGWKNAKAGQSKGGKFAVTLKGIPAGGPYKLDLQVGKETLCVKSFYVGDVWLLAGQSNMEGVGNMTDPAEPHPLIRAFAMHRRGWDLAKDPLHVTRESPDVCHNGAVPMTEKEARRHRRETQKGVGVGIFFAREMLKRSGVPQGLVCTAHGGTNMVQWDPARKKLKGESLYYSMLQSVKATGQPVAGMLWYQGESDANKEHVNRYTERMKNLVASTRRDLKQSDLPWIVVQIARHFADYEEYACWNSIQEQQRLLPKKIKNLDTVAAVDLSLDDSIHISALAYRQLGSRMAHIADRLVYRNKKAKLSPVVREARFVGPTTAAKSPMGIGINITYDNIVGRLQSEGEAVGFALVNPEGQIWPFVYKTTLHGNVVHLSFDRQVTGDLRLHYGYNTRPICNITDGRGLSLPVFGPMEVIGTEAYLPFVTNWKVTGVQPGKISLGKISCPNPAALGAKTKSYTLEGFINEHLVWQGKSGQAYFSAKIELAERMHLQFLMGYDGPFRLWIDKKPFFTDLKGTNPCLADQSKKTIWLKAGTHNVTVAMDLNGGHAWGFMLRLVRIDVSRAQVKNRSYKAPRYSV